MPSIHPPHSPFSSRHSLSTSNSSTPSCRLVHHHQSSCGTKDENNLTMDLSSTTDDSSSSDGGGILDAAAAATMTTCEKAYSMWNELEKNDIEDELENERKTFEDKKDDYIIKFMNLYDEKVKKLEQ